MAHFDIRIVEMFDAKRFGQLMKSLGMRWAVVGETLVGERPKLALAGYHQAGFRFESIGLLPYQS